MDCVNLHRTPANGIGAVKLAPVAGTFQVLVVGN